MQIFGDWGTTRLRLFRGAGERCDRREGPGIGHLDGKAPTEALIAALGPWQTDARRHGLFLSGMASARGGLAELPYLPCPVSAGLWRDAAAAVEIDGIALRMARGLCATNLAGRPDVMRGEETQIFGALAQDPELACGQAIIVLPGTHSKWTEMNDGEIRRFHSFPTGELFAMLRDHSTLSAPSTAAPDPEGFAAGIAMAPDGLLASLFQARAAQLVRGQSTAWSAAFLSGLLIASEFREALALLDERPRRLLLIGAPALVALYRQVAQSQKLAPEALDGDACVRAGLQLIAGQVDR